MHWKIRERDCEKGKERERLREGKRERETARREKRESDCEKGKERERLRERKRERERDCEKGKREITFRSEFLKERVMSISSGTQERSATHLILCSHICSMFQ